MTGHGDKDWTEELEQDENRGQDIPENFGFKLKKEFARIYNNESKDLSFAYLFEELRKQVLNEKYRICDSFLATLSIDEFDSTFIVHVLNALSPAKNRLKEWEKFKIDAFNKLVFLKGEEYASMLMKVILENNVIEPPSYQQSFEVWEQEKYGNEEGQSNP